MPTNKMISSDSAYPLLLKEVGIKSTLYMMGDYNIAPTDTLVGVIGTRKPSVYGQVVTQQIVAELVYKKCVVVSGFMYGIDMEAHHAAIDNGGKTICVLGYGFEYLKNNTPKYLLERFCSSGAFISEYEHKESPKKWTFAKRNQIIAGLCSLLLVIEAEQKSGSFITCHWANKYKREVYAVPGSILSDKSIGTNTLIQNRKAKLFRSINDLSEILGEGKSEVTGNIASPLMSLDSNSKYILELLKAGPIGSDQLINNVSSSLNMSLDEVNVLVQRVCLDGLIKQQGNIYYVL